MDNLLPIKSHQPQEARPSRTRPRSPAPTGVHAHGHENMGTHTRANTRASGDAPIFEAQPEVNGRLTVTGVTYHQAPGEQPTSWETQWVCTTHPEGQPYQRRCKATEEWQPLDLGWSEEVSLLAIRNEEGKFWVNPTEQERAEMEAKVIELAVMAGGQLVTMGLVRPGRSGQIEPSNLGSWRIRCLSGYARYTLCLFPA